MEKKGANFNYDELVRHVELMAEPIDFDALISGGLLVKEGKWYRVPDINALPEHVTKKIKETRTDKEGTKVTFYDHKKYERMKKKYV